MSPKASTRLLATQSDERLVAMARDGHDRAFEALVQRYRSPLLRYCRRLRLADNRAEDVVQQALMQAWAALRRGVEVRELRPWLYRITHNAAVNVARDATREGAHMNLEIEEASALELRPGGTAPEPGIPGRLALRETLSDMAALPQMQREVIFRTAVAGQSHEEVAFVLGITDGAVRGLLYRARATLRGALTALTPPPLLAWMAGAGQSAGGERLSELAAGGGSVGLSGLLVKGGAVALTAGTLLTGAAIVHDHDHSHHAPAHRHTPARTLTGAGGSALAALGAPSGTLARAGASAGNAGGGALHSQASFRHRRPGGRVVSLRVQPSGAAGESPGAHTPRSPSRALDTAPSAGGGGAHTPGGSGESEGGFTSHSSSPSTPPAGSSAGGGAPGGGSASGGSGGGSEGSSSGGGSTGGAGGGGSTGGGGGSSGGSGSEGGASGGGSAGGGSGGSTGGSGGGSSPEGGSGSPPPAGSGSPVGTVVHEVTGLLEHTVHGLLGH